MTLAATFSFRISSIGMLLQACEWCEGSDASKDLFQAWQLVNEFALAEADRVFLKLLLQLEKKQADERLMSGDEVQSFCTEHSVCISIALCSL